MTTRDVRHALVMQAKLELARRNFFDYAALTAPDFYKREREFLVTMADELQQFFEHDNEHDVLVMNVPPRHGKSRTSSKFVEWLFGGNPQLKIMTASYNEILSKTFSKNIRNTISEQKVERDIVVYSDIFKNVRIKRGDGAMNLWSLEGQYANYLATSPGGTATGFGANCFPAGTLVHTDCGPVPIEEIKVGEHRALSWYTKGGKIRYNQVRAMRRKVSNGIIRIKTTSGAVVECTPDHRIFVEGRGFIPAKDLRIGDETKEVQREVFCMPATEDRQGRKVSGLLQKIKRQKHREVLREMREGVQSPSARTQEGCSERVQQKLLFAEMCESKHIQNTKSEGVSCVQGVSSEGKEILLRQLQENRGESQEGRKENQLFALRQEVLPGEFDSEALFCQVQKRSPFFEDDWEGEPELQKRKELSDRVLQSENCGVGKGWTKVYGLRNVRTHEGNSWRFKQNEFSCAPQGRRHPEQRHEKLSDHVRQLSYHSPQNEKIKEITPLEKEVEVYDIQVDNDHNFFANGILVHNCVIIDDLIKNALEANNARVLEEHWEWFTNTMLSRLEADGKIIIIMTRWNSNDLAGRALKMLPEAGYKVKHINMKAVQDDGSMLCDDILSRREYDKKVSVMGEDIASANYQQEPIDLKGKLYNTLLVYDELPSAYDRIVSYCDTADDGKDYLSHIVALSTPTHDYVVDVVYTQAPMEETEKEVAASIAYYGADIEPMFESNNGGKMYARSVERILQEEYGLDIYVNWFHQTQNKQARILTHAPEVMRRVAFPSDWEERWPEFYKDVTTYQRTGKNAHDDAPDSLTGLVEYTTEKGGEITSGTSPYGKRRF